MEAVNHEEHRMYAAKIARILAFTELEGDHDDAEGLVYDDSDSCWQCVAVELIKLLRDPLDPETLRAEADQIKQEVFGDALWHAKQKHEKEQEPPLEPWVLRED